MHKLPEFRSKNMRRQGGEFVRSTESKILLTNSPLLHLLRWGRKGFWVKKGAPDGNQEGLKSFSVRMRSSLGGEPSGKGLLFRQVRA